MPCGIHRPVLHSPAGSSQARCTVTPSVRSAWPRPTNSYIPPALKRITPLPYFGIDRIGDFDGSASPACGNPVRSFPQVLKEAELMVAELRWKPAVGRGAVRRFAAAGSAGGAD